MSVAVDFNACVICAGVSPGFAGGHIFLLGVEALNRGPLSPRVRERTQMVGMSLLLLLFVFVIYNDVVQLLS